MPTDPARLTPGQLKILQAVATLLEDPNARITISEIAKEIQVTDGAIYRHYRNKDAIFKSIVSYMEANLLTPLQTVQNQSTDTYRRLQIVFETYMTFLEGHPGLARLMLGHSAIESAGLGERMKLLHGKLRAQVAQLLKFGQAQGVLRAELQPEQGAELFYGLVIATAMTQSYDLPYIDQAQRWSIFKHAVFK